MNSAEIYYALKSYRPTKTFFMGVFSCNTIPNSFFKRKRPGAIIFNLDPNYKTGTHWVTLYTSGTGTLEYYDSYGYPPFHIHLFKNFKRFKYNKKRIQGNTNVCGFYTMYFVIKKSHKISMKAIVKPFGSNYCLNDEYIKSTLCDTFAEEDIELCSTKTSCAKNGGFVG